MQIIHTAESVSSGFFAEQHQSSDETVYVYQSAKGGYHVLPVGQTMIRQEVKKNKYTSCIPVTTKLYTYKHEQEYPSSNPGRSFQVTLLLQVKVSNPIAVIQQQVADIKAYLDMHVSRWIRPLTRSSDVIEDFGLVQSQLEELNRHSSIMQDLEQAGFAVLSWQATADLSAEDMAFYKQVESKKRNAKLEEMDQTSRHDRETRDRAFENNQQMADLNHFRELAQNYGLVQAALMAGGKYASLSGFILNEYKERKQSRQSVIDNAMKNGWNPEEVEHILSIVEQEPVLLGAAGEPPLLSQAEKAATTWNLPASAKPSNTDDPSDLES